jgi:type IV pilus assembly protein PilB
MADLNIVERRRPQDGQFESTIDGRVLDVRVATTATIWGEKVVLRLLDKTRSLHKLSELGMPDHLYSMYSKAVASPFGMVIVSGPTGSGKTTTLYATLTEISREDINVMTIEDPVEYVFPEINQIQINEQADVTFASGLKSILRQDPNVILVGEVRDVETARIAVQSALTGHMVLSSIHATDSVAALYRLLDMGIESFLVASSIVSVVAQRLVRRICRTCEAPYTPSAIELAVWDRLGGFDKDVWLRGTGCNICSGTGFFERVGVYEVLTVTDEIRRAVVAGRSIDEVRELAWQGGLQTMHESALQLVEDNITTVDELIRNVYTGEDFGAAPATREIQADQRAPAPREPAVQLSSIESDDADGPREHARENGVNSLASGVFQVIEIDDDARGPESGAEQDDSHPEPVDEADIEHGVAQ